MFKKAFAFVGALLLATAPLFAATPTPEQIERFSNVIERALKDQNPSAVSAVYSVEGVPGEFVDEAIIFWKFQAKEIAANKITFENVVFLPLEEYLAKPNVNQKATRSMVDPQTMNSHVYVRNLPIIGFISVNFTTKGSTMKGNFGSLQPVGFDGNEIKIALLKRQDGSQPAASAPIPLPPASANPPSPAAVEAFIAAVSKAWKTGSPNDYKTCVSSEGVSEAGMDQKIYRWETFNVADIKDGKKIFAGANFITMEDLQAGKEGLPTSLVIEPAVTNGNTYAFNLPLVGVVRVRSTSEHGNASTTLPVGIDSLGNLKIASQVRVAK